jgi:hypothetical protein
MSYDASGEFAMGGCLHQMATLVLQRFESNLWGSICLKLSNRWAQWCPEIWVKFESFLGWCSGKRLAGESLRGAHLLDDIF